MKNGNVSGLEGKFVMISEQSMNKAVNRVILRARMYACVCVHVCVQYTCTCLHADQRSVLSVILNDSLPGNLRWYPLTRSLLNLSAWLDSKPWDFACLSLRGSTVGMQVMPGFSCEYSVSELRSSDLSTKLFTQRAVSPTVEVHSFDSLFWNCSFWWNDHRDSKHSYHLEQLFRHQYVS